MADLNSLIPELTPWAKWLLEVGRANDETSSLTVTSARRDFTEQSRLYQRYLRGENGGLPALPPGKSMHEKGRAFDMARPGIDPHEDMLLAALGGLWNSVGGRWHSSDPVHFEV